MVPDRHGASAWKRWIFCLTDHLDFENLENRRRYQNPGKPRTAGLCGREVVASDHLPLSSTFFGRPKPPDLPFKTAAVVPLPSLFFLWRYPRKITSPASAHTDPTWPAASSASPMPPLCPKPHTAPHRRQRLPDLPRALVFAQGHRRVSLSQRFFTLFTVVQILIVLALPASAYQPPRKNAPASLRDAGGCFMGKSVLTPASDTASPRSVPGWRVLPESACRRSCRR